MKKQTIEETLYTLFKYKYAPEFLDVDNFEITEEYENTFNIEYIGEHIIISFVYGFKQYKKIYSFKDIFDSFIEDSHYVNCYVDEYDNDFVLNKIIHNTNIVELFESQFDNKFSISVKYNNNEITIFCITIENIYNDNKRYIFFKIKNKLLNTNKKLTFTDIENIDFDEVKKFTIK